MWYFIEGREIWAKRDCGCGKKKMRKRREDERSCFPLRPLENEVKHCGGYGEARTVLTFRMFRREGEVEGERGGGERKGEGGGRKWSWRENGDFEGKKGEVDSEVITISVFYCLRISLSLSPFLVHYLFLGTSFGFILLLSVCICFWGWGEMLSNLLLRHLSLLS